MTKHQKEHHPSQLVHRVRLVRELFNTWRGGALLLCAAFLLPMASLFILAFEQGDLGENIWPHLLQTIVPTQIQTTLLLLLGVGVLATAIGTGAAWLVSMFNFYGVRVLSYALALPLALPTYIVAYAYGELLDPAGALYQFWGTFLPQTLYPDIRNLGGAIILLSLVLYPYVYFAARLAFLRQSVQLLDSARILGAHPNACFWRIALPLARPSIAAGTILVLMETLNDIGAVEFLGVHTLTYGVYNTWLIRGSLSGAAQLALLLLTLIILLVGIERATRAQRSFASPTTTPHTLPRLPLTGVKALVAAGLCTLPVLFGFILPLGQLIRYAQKYPLNSGLIAALGNSLSVATLSAVLVVGIALFLGHFARTGMRFDARLVRSVTFGYAVPGTILAIAILTMVQVLNARFDGSGIIFGGIGILIFAYLVRFMAMGISLIEARYAQIPYTYDFAARSLGTTRGGLLWKIHGRTLITPILAASLFVFVETLKELPATLILRPFDFETLAVHAYAHANLGTLEAAGAPSLMIIAAGMVAVLVSMRLQNRAL